MQYCTVEVNVEISRNFTTLRNRTSTTLLNFPEILSSNKTELLQLLDLLEKEPFFKFLLGKLENNIIF